MGWQGSSASVNLAKMSTQIEEQTTKFSERFHAVDVRLSGLAHDITYVNGTLDRAFALNEQAARLNSEFTIASVEAEQKLSILRGESATELERQDVAHKARMEEAHRQHLAHQEENKASMVAYCSARAYSMSIAGSVRGIAQHARDFSDKALLKALRQAESCGFDFVYIDVSNQSWTEQDLKIVSGYCDTNESVYCHSMNGFETSLAEFWQQVGK